MLDTEIHTAKRPAPADGRRSDASSEDAVAVKLQALAEMDYDALRSAWRRHYRAHPPKRVARDLLMLGVAWKIQEQAYGGLRAATKAVSSIWQRPWSGTATSPGTGLPVSSWATERSESNGDFVPSIRA